MRPAVRPRTVRGALLLLLLAAPSLPVFAQPKVEVVPQSNSPSPTVSAVGEATAEVRPDAAVLTFAVEIRDPDSSRAVRVNERMTKRAVEGIEKSGVATTDVVVDHYRMKHVVSTFLPALGTNQPVEFQLEQHGTYLVTSTIVVTTHQISAVGTIIAAAVAAGVDRIDRVRYEASNLPTVEGSLMGQAIQAARTRAESLAGDAGLTLGEPLRVIQLSGTTTSTTVAAGNTVSGQMSPPRLEARLRVRVVYAATKGSG